MLGKKTFWSLFPGIKHKPAPKSMDGAVFDKITTPPSQQPTPTVDFVGRARLSLFKPF
jgi:hypothetical protein